MARNSRKPVPIYVGMDLSAASVALAKQNLRCGTFRPLAGFRPESLPFPDKLFDLVYSCRRATNHTPTSPGRRRGHRILRPQGRAIVDDVSQSVAKLLRWNSNSARMGALC